MWNFLKRMYLKVRNFVAVNVVKAVRYSAAVIAVGEEKKSFLKKLMGYAMMVGAVVGAVVVVWLAGVALMLAAMYTLGSIGIIIAGALLGFVAADTTGAVLLILEGANNAAKEGVEKEFFAVIDAAAAGV
jgi:hypothetical protein